MEQSLPLNNNLKIFLADDDADDREMFSDALTESGIRCKLKTFINGCELLHFLDKEDSELPDILFLDLNMPILDGLATLRKLRQNVRCKNLCVAIYSTSGSIRDYENTFREGANLYIQKPSNFFTLQKTLSTLLNLENISDKFRTVGKNFIYKQ